MTWVNLFFVQGEAADELLQLLEDEGAKAVVGHLIDCGLEDSCSSDDEPWGNSDDTEEVKLGSVEYVLSWNTGLNYLGLSYKKEKKS